MEQKDYYKILGISENASAEEIKKTYRKLAFQYHPDRNPGNEGLMKELNEAYAVLSDQKKRSEYDLYRRSYGHAAWEQFRQTHSEQDIFRDSDINRVFDELSKAFGFRSPEEIFSREQFYGDRFRTFQFSGPGFAGKMFFFSWPASKPYKDMTGSADHRTKEMPASRPTLLSRLLFQGLRAFQRHIAERYGFSLPERGDDVEDKINITPEVASSGGKVLYHYTNPDNRRDLFVSIPPGVRDGQRIRLRGIGKQGQNGGESGDLYLKVRISIPLQERIKRLLFG